MNGITTSVNHANSRKTYLTRQESSTEHAQTDPSKLQFIEYFSATHEPLMNTSSKLILYQPSKNVNILHNVPHIIKIEEFTHSANPISGKSNKGMFFNRGIYINIRAVAN